MFFRLKAEATRLGMHLPPKGGSHEVGNAPSAYKAEATRLEMHLPMFFRLEAAATRSREDISWLPPSGGSYSVAAIISAMTASPLVAGCSGGSGALTAASSAARQRPARRST